MSSDVPALEGLASIRAALELSHPDRMRPWPGESWREFRGRQRDARRRHQVDMRKLERASNKRVLGAFVAGGSPLHPFRGL